MSGSTEHSLLRISSLSAVAGAILGLVANALHPHATDESSEAILREIAASTVWVSTHVGIIVAVLLVIGGLVGLTRSLSGGPGAAFAQLGLAAALLGGAVVFVSTSIDGFVMRQVAAAWISAPADQSIVALHVAIAVKQINFGIWSVGMFVFFGVTFVLYGLAIAFSVGYPQWLGWGAVLSGTGDTAASMIQIYSGSPTAVAELLSLVSSLLLIGWIFAIGVLMWRRAAEARGSSAVPATEQDVPISVRTG